MTSRDDRADPLGRDEAGVSEVVGFILMFSMAFVVLAMAMVLVADRVDESSERSQKTVFSEAAATVSSGIQEAVAFGDLYPNSTYRRNVALPEALGGVAHEARITNAKVTIQAVGPSLDIQAQQGGYDLAAEGIEFSDTTTNGRFLTITYDGSGSTKVLTIDESAP